MKMPAGHYQHATIESGNVIDDDNSWTYAQESKKGMDMATFIAVQLEFTNLVPFHRLFFFPAEFINKDVDKLPKMSFVSC